MDTYLRSISIRHRLLGGTAIVSVLILTLGLWAGASYKRLQGRADEMLDAQALASRESGAVIAALERIQRYEQSVLLNSDNAVEAAEHKTRWDKEVAAATALLGARGQDSAGATQLAEGASGLAAYAKEVGPVLQQVVDAKLDHTAGYAYAQRALPDLEKARTAMGALAKAGEARVAAERAEARATGNLNPTSASSAPSSRWASSSA